MHLRRFLWPNLVARDLPYQHYAFNVDISIFRTPVIVLLRVVQEFDDKDRGQEFDRETEGGRLQPYGLLSAIVVKGCVYVIFGSDASSKLAVVRKFFIVLVLIVSVRESIQNPNDLLHSVRTSIHCRASLQHRQ
jgi:hypothetical protein